MQYGEILTRAWQILWKFKVLWIFGLFAGCAASGQRSGSNFNYNFPAAAAGSETTNLPPELTGPIQTVVGLVRSVPGWAWLLLVLVFVCLGLLGLMLSTLGQAGLIRGAWAADSGAPTLQFGALFQEAMGYFWRVLGVNLLIGSPTALLFILGSVVGIIGILPYIQTGATDAARSGAVIWLCLLLPLICLALPLLIVVSLLGPMALTAVVGENLGVFAAIRRGWGVFRANLGRLLLMGFMLYLISLVVGWVIGLPAFLFAIPVGAGALGGMGGLVWLGLVGLVCLFFPFTLLINGLIQVYSNNVWTLTFRRLTAPPPPPPSPYGPSGPGIDLLPPVA